MKSGAIRAQNKGSRSWVQDAAEDCTPENDVQRGTVNVIDATERAISACSVDQKGWRQYSKKTKLA